MTTRATGTAAELSEAEFAEVRTLLADAAGLAIDGSRRAALTSVLRDLRDARGCPSTAAYLEWVRRDPTECQRLVEASVIGETHWLRTPPQIAALREVILPRLLARRGDRPVRIWSAGCASGEEVWSLAMLATEAGARPGDVEVLGTDVSGRALEAAASAEYGERALHLVGELRRARFLDRTADDPPTWRVRDALRTLASFQRHDLVHDPLPVPPGSVDLVLCRNVTIYFARETTARVVDRLLDALHPHGTLILGHSETLWQVTDRVELERIGDAFTYRHATNVTAGTAGVRVAAPVASRPDVPATRRAVSATRAVAPAARAAPRAPTRTAAPAASAPQAQPAVSTARAQPTAPAARAQPAAPATGVRGALAAGDYVAAEQLALAGVANDPMSGTAHYLLGLVLATTGRHEAAVVALRKATYADPDDGLAHFLLATSLASAGHAGPARAAYAAAAGALLARPGAVNGRPELGGRDVAELARLCRSLSGAKVAT